MAEGAGGQVDLNKLPAGAKLKVLAQSLYGYGYTGPYVALYLNPKVDCGPSDFEDLLNEFTFLDHPDQSTDKSVLVYYTSEFNHLAKMNLFCLVSTII